MPDEGPTVSTCHLCVFPVCLCCACVSCVSSTYMSLGRQVLFCPVCGLCLMIDSTPVSPDVSPVCFDVPFSLCVCLGSLKKIFFFKFWLHCIACRILVPRPGTEPLPSACGAQSFNRWTAREVLVSCLPECAASVCAGSCPLWDVVTKVTNWWGRRLVAV